MFELGQWNALCQRCGRKYKARQIRLEWTGLRVCHGPSTTGCWEPQQPQDFVKGRADRQAPAWSSPEAPDTFVVPGPPDTDAL
jgi:hypothetical protein